MFDCGVNLCYYDNDYVEELKEYSMNVGVNGWIAISNSRKEWNKNLLYTKLHSKDGFKIYTTIGIHPHNAKDAIKETFEEMENIIKNKKDIVAVGECGLDYNRNLSLKDKQKQVFIAQLHIASKYNLPLYLHDRDASDDFYEIINSHKHLNLKGIVHCFTGKPDVLKQYLDYGFYIGITGWICDNRRNRDLLESIKCLPLDKLIIETDAPFLTPPKYKEKYDTTKNQPDALLYVVDMLAKIYQISNDELIRATSENRKKLFGV